MQAVSQPRWCLDIDRGTDLAGAYEMVKYVGLSHTIVDLGKKARVPFLVNGEFNTSDQLVSSANLDYRKHKHLFSSQTISKKAIIEYCS
jgi:hypothetical protein